VQRFGKEALDYLSCYQFIVDQKLIEHNKVLFICITDGRTTYNSRWIMDMQNIRKAQEL
jgi:hypothetical protein